MSITREQVEHVANLARLALTEEEKRLYAEQLGYILDYANQLQQLDVENVQPTSHVLPITNVTRSDESRIWITHEEALKHAPDQAEGEFRVPAVMEG